MIIPAYFPPSSFNDYCPDCGSILQMEIRPLTDSEMIENKINWKNFKAELRRKHPILSNIFLLVIRPAKSETILHCPKCKREFKKAIQF